ncbi:MAG: hypothetical protein CMM52_03300 [Rhodospirillaceae bacterium]|nr:hypothetical protein [Rhodospirillaceae bacterium]|tara:strand:+ start:7030 stop:9630 length:2601 start_codon:yes stop_codon:yes gene_type:complete
MEEAFKHFIGHWVDGVRRFALVVVGLSILLTAGSAWYVATNLSIDTDTTDMLSAELPFRQDSIQLRRAFPQFANNIVVVIDGATPDQVDDGALALGRGLKEQTKTFHEVFDPRGDAFFRQNGLLFLETTELETLADRLASAQVFLGKLWQDPSLRGLFSILRLAIENAEDTQTPGSLSSTLEKISAAINETTAGSVKRLSWKSLIDGSESDQKSPNRRILIVQPSLDSASLQPAGEAISAIRKTAEQLGLTPANGFKVRLTGSAVLEEEELESVAEGMGLAGILSALLVSGLLGWGLRSGRLVFAMLLTLVVGLLWTAGLATFVVGRLNLISVAFAVLFIGLSVDFGIHFALRFREGLTAGNDPSISNQIAGKSIGGALTLCAVAASISFFSFVFTDYVGLAELGIIAGMGMFVALVANLTVLPALITVMPLRGSVNLTDITGTSSQWVTKKARSVVLVTLLLALAASATLPMIHFDFDPMNLRDPNTESVDTLLDLTAESETGPYSIDILAPNLKTAKDLISRLEKLKSVDYVLSLDRIVPKNQGDKLAIIEEIAFLLLPGFEAQRKRPTTPSERLKSIIAFEKFLGDLKKQGPAALSQALNDLRIAISKADKSESGLAKLEKHLIGSLHGRLTALKDAMKATEVTVDTIPSALKRRYESGSGAVRLEVFPEDDLRDRSNLDRFVADVRAVAPRATGSPVIIIEAGNAVINAFVKAALISVCAIAVLVIVLMRDVRDVLLVFAPLTLAAIFTIAATVILDLPFNFANVIVLPLLFGLGVASAIHFVMRSHDEAGLGELMGTSTPRAVVFSALTTIGSFASIALSSHPGTASMGILLAISIGFTLLCTIYFLPALMACLASRIDKK